MTNPLIDAETLAMQLDACVVVDCRHDLMNPSAGLTAYQAGHIPGAYFLSQDTDLAGNKTGTNGRHPLPNTNELAQKLRARGLSEGKLLVAYDAHGGLFASRMWWLARWLGHAKVAVLDGGINAWQALKLPLSTEAPALRDVNASHAPFGTPLEEAVAIEQVQASLGQTNQWIVDARAPERYRGEVEPIDPVAGRIPGAVNRPHGLSLRPDGRFKPAEVLAHEWKAFLRGRDPSAVVHQCGSGITACHNQLSMHAAGLNGARVFIGSWSQWCADSSRPVERG
jgi:thiosulfate/3-mercaptopyruvate sulfurtransferase